MLQAPGKVALATLGAFAEYYSANLSAETKKGKAERKKQGLYNGVLPFGVKKSRDGIPAPDPDTYPGLLTAFRLAAEGQSDRKVADALNAAGHRTTGNRGPNPFTKDTVCRMLQNRFYLGELPDGSGGWMPGVHDAVLDPDLFDAAQRARAANRTSVTGATSVPRANRTYSLSGLAVCGGCGGRLHFHTAPNGRARAYCYRVQQRGGCGQRSVYLDAVDGQIGAYLATFHLPEETVALVVRLYEEAHGQRDDAERRRREIGSRLERIKELYKWGDTTREAYVAERDALEAELGALRGSSNQAEALGQAAAFLRDLPSAWEQASPEQRNALARLVFQSVEIADDRVTAVTPRADFAPFFNLAAEAEGVEEPEGGGENADGADFPERRRQLNVLRGGSDGDPFRGCILPPGAILFASITERRRAGLSQRDTYQQPRVRCLSPDQLEVLWREAPGRTLRELALTFGVSHETVRKTLQNGRQLKTSTH